MPVLMTIASTAALFGRRATTQERTSLLDPEATRLGVMKLPPGTTRSRALHLVDELAFRRNVYIEESGDAMATIDAAFTRTSPSVEAMNAALGVADEAFIQAVNDLMRLRQELRTLLTDEEWRTVFGV